MKKSKVVLLVVISIMTIAIAGFYLMPTNIVEKILNDANYYGQTSDRPVARPEIRVHDYRIFSDNTILSLSELGLIDITPGGKDLAQAFFADEFIDPVVFKEIISSLSVERRFYKSLRPTAYSLGQLAMEINVSYDYSLLLGPLGDVLFHKSKSIPYYRVKNADEILERLVKAIDDYFLKNPVDSN